MSNSLVLLAQTPTTALKTLVGDLLNGSVALDDLEVGTPVLTGNTGQVAVKIAPEAYHKSGWNHFGIATVLYTRMDLNDVLGSLGLAFEVPAQTTTAAVVALIAQALSIVFDPADYVDEAITVTGPNYQYPLKAGAGSTRWSGTVYISLYPTV